MEQPLYTAKDFATVLGITKSQLSRFEEKGTLPQPAINEHGIRVYMPHDIPAYLKALDKGPLVDKKRRQIFLNFKGGTGKTSLSAFYSFRLAQLGFNVLMLDLDPQGHLTQCFGVDHDTIQATLYNVLIEKMEVEDAIVPTAMKNLSLIPACLDLSPVELALTSINARETRLKKCLLQAQEKFDVIVMDASPSIGLLNLNGILASTELIVPVLADFLSYHGLKILFETVATIEEDFDFTLEDGIHIILNHYNATMNIAQRAREALQTHYSEYMMNTIVRQDIKMAEAGSRGLPIHLYEPRSKGASDIDDLIKEIFPNLPIVF